MTSEETVIYCRLVQDAQDYPETLRRLLLDLEAQEQRTTQYAAERGYNVRAIFKDIGNKPFGLALVSLLATAREWGIKRLVCVDPLCLSHHSFARDDIYMQLYHLHIAVECTEAGHPGGAGAWSLFVEAKKKGAR